MSHIPHPSACFSSDVINILRSHSALAEREQKLSREQLAIIHQHNWFKMLVPKMYGGLQLSLPEVVKIEEAISWIDGSVGWVVTLCAGAGWFGGFLSAELSKRIFSLEDLCICGSGAATGTAEISDNGYIVNGKWSYASGSPDATHFTANCVITQNGLPVTDESGSATILSFIFPRQEVAIVPEWNSIGMIATASHAFTVKDLFVKQENTFRIATEATLIKEQLYLYPFLQLAEVTLAANISGMSLHFLDLCEVLLQNKKDRNNAPLISNPLVYEKLASVKTIQMNARDEMYAALQKSWDEHVNISYLAEVSSTARNLARQARNLVDELYPYCGLTAANPNTEINRVWRDLHTASQHSLLAF